MAKKSGDASDASRGKIIMSASNDEGATAKVIEDGNVTGQARTGNTQRLQQSDGDMTVIDGQVQ